MATHLAGLVAAAIRGGARSLVLAGGSTPRLAYSRLARLPLAWGAVTVLFGDERCVPPDHPESNYQMARTELLDRVLPGSVHRIPAELGPERAAELYDAVVESLPGLDVVLLGMGADGHTASLFPAAPELSARGRAVGVRGAPKPPPERVSLTLAALREGRRVIVVATGEDKSEAVVKALRHEVPAGMIPRAEFLLDRAAARSL